MTDSKTVVEDLAVSAEQRDRMRALLTEWWAKVLPEVTDAAEKVNAEVSAAAALMTRSEFANKIALVERQVMT